MGILGFWHETNTFSTSPTTIEQFREFELSAGSALAEKNAHVGSVIGGFLDATHFDLVPIFSAGAWPSGPIEEDTMGELLDRARQELIRAGGLDGILLNLHGAMVAKQFKDAELSALGLVREILGEIPVSGVLDLHANPAPELIAGIDTLVSYDTYPHIDMRERGVEAAQLLTTVLGGTPLRSQIRKVPLLVAPIAQGTDLDPMRLLQARANRRAKDAGLHRVCVIGGFAYSDVTRAGMSVMAVHDEAHAQAASEVLDATVADIENHAHDFEVVRDSPSVAVDRALEAEAHPVVLVDVADNVGGGSPGDGTALLSELLRGGASGAVVPIIDRDVAELAQELGEGAVIETSVGGKTDRRHGTPVPIQGHVVRITDGRYRTAGPWMTGREFSMGTTAVIEVGGVTLLVMSERTPAFHSEQFTSQGIDPTRASIIVVKGALAWRAAFGRLAGEVIEVAGPGITPVDVNALPRQTTPMTF
ncbi:M81 family metallopeptidase [Nesterenkonia sphaerica]|uniref:M81 family metallopeptidase n=1 Tax=Nesterenkonia sphaerica TaxID=1804988 RepID=A0A5R9AMM1_9MICC|nr:M81 family metallopeptidase [Nesterenkonia sphaerica]